MTNLIERLIAAHRALNRDIRRELSHRIPDPFRLMQLKKRRLAVKDRLYALRPEPGGLRRSAREALRTLRGRRQQTLGMEH